MKVGLHDLMSVLIGKGRETGLISPSLSWEDTRKGSHLQARKRVLIRRGICRHLDLGLPSLWNCEKQWDLRHPAYAISL